MKFRLILSDVDSTLIENEVIDLLAQASGRGEEVSAITQAAMRGELDFATALKQRVSYLEGLPESVIEEVAAQLSFSPGALELIEFCSKNQIPFGAVSGGFMEVLASFGLTEDLDFVRANSLEIQDGILTGRIRGEIVDRTEKAKTLRRFASECRVAIDETIAIGDGANDIEMLQAAGLGISFRGKEALNAVADLQIKESLAEVIPYLKTR